MYVAVRFRSDGNAPDSMNTDVVGPLNDHEAEEVAEAWFGEPHFIVPPASFGAWLERQRELEEEFS